MRASRLLAMLIMLQGGGRLTAQILAERFEVSRRTIYRDLDELSAAGVPVVAERGVGGGVALKGGFRTDLSGLTREEADAFVLGRFPALAHQLGVAAAAAGAQAKLTEAVGPVGKIAGRFHLDPSGWYRAPVAPECLREVASAVFGRRRLEIDYQGWTRRATHRVDPLGLVVKGGEWYLLAQKETGRRVYKVASVLGARSLEESSFMPAEFDLARAWAEQVTRFEDNLFTSSASLVVHAEAENRFARFGSKALEALRRAPREEDGSRRVEIPIETEENFAAEVLAFGSTIEVVGPASLKEKIRHRLDELQSLYPSGRNGFT